eukprot:TRINITY_DN4037_c0_g1_i2.p1 TRINITY_DN4037_c0_g1~~TRINITY_DN4037_c0_g1_i2.p1  ORF type:complete len:393 (-),score=90.75 TRINITY_DN4037_c0_g1_i2:67-1245(-)
MAKTKTVNIPRDIDDEFHRYKMPVLQTKVEGRGNGIKTVIVNMKAIAEALERPPSYPTKFFGVELGAHTICDDSADRYLVNGKHDADSLYKILDDFIDKYVLCKQCDRNPETEMLIKGERIELKCKACGGRSQVDMAHRLSTYVLKHPPPKDLSKQSGKSARNQKREDQAKQMTDYSDKDFKEMKESEKNVEWSQDTSEEAVALRRKAQLGEQSNALMDKALDDPVEELATLLNLEPTLSEKELISKVTQLASKEQWSERKTLQTIFGCLFDNQILKQIKKKAPILSIFVTTELHQKIIMLCLEKLCQADKAVIDQLPSVLQGFYDEGILEEGVLSKWHSHPNKRQNPKLSSAIRAKAAPFIKWLKEAEEESESDDDEPAARSPPPKKTGKK